MPRLAKRAEAKFFWVFPNLFYYFLLIFPKFYIRRAATGIEISAREVTNTKNRDLRPKTVQIYTEASAREASRGEIFWGCPN